MPKQPIITDASARPGGAYSQGLRAGGFVFVAGQVGRDPASGQMAGDTIEAQTTQTLKNIQAILAAGGATLADVVKATVHLSDLALFQRFNEAYASLVPEPRPVRTTVGSQLPSGVLVEIDMIAYTGA